MILKNEHLINLKLQEYNIDGIMKLISLPCNFNIAIIITLLLFVSKFISIDNLLIIIISLSYMIILKKIIKRRRPYQKFNNIKNLSGFNFNDTSLPSGHTIYCFIITRILIKNLNKNNKLYFILKIYPYLIMISRISLGVHYISDTFFGLLIGKFFIEVFN